MPLINLDSRHNVENQRFLSSSRILSWLRTLTGYDIEVIESHEVDRPTLIARRINVGNAGKEAVVQMPLNFESMSDIRRFAKSATDVTSTDEGDMTLKPEDWREFMSKYCEVPDDRPQGVLLNRSSKSTTQESSSARKLSLPKWFKSKKKDFDRVVEHYADYADYADYAEDDIDDSIFIDKQIGSVSYKCEPAPSLEIEDEEKEIVTIEQERELALKAIQAQIIDYVTKFHADPSQLINTLLEGKIVIGSKEQPSPLVVNNDLKIVLPNYNEMEVKMPAMCRAIYILFLKHPEGIALRDISDHRTDLEDIYSMVMPGRSEEKAHEAINNLLDPMSNTLNEYISKIKRCFKSCIIDEKLASNYIITGKRGETYRIALDPSLITLPRAVAG